MKRLLRLTLFDVAIVFAAACLFWAGGCAGTSYELLTYDACEAAAKEAAKGVNAFNAAVQVDTGKRQADLMAALAKDVSAIASGAKLDQAAADAMGKRVADAMTTHWANYMEQERRREKLLSVTLDNLAYIVEVCEGARKFVLYRSDIGAQWRDYIQSTSRARLGTIDAAPAAGGK